MRVGCACSPGWADLVIFPESVIFYDLVRELNIDKLCNTTHF